MMVVSRLFVPFCNPATRFHCNSPKLLVTVTKFSSAASKTTNSDVKKNAQEAKVSFHDAQNAYLTKTLYELVRSLTILRLCSVKFIASQSLQISEKVEKLLGERIFDYLMKKTFYGQFVGGDDSESLHRTIKYFEKENIRPMIACMMEAEVESKTDVKSNMKVHDNNTERTLQCLQMISKYSEMEPKIQTKLTGIMSPKLLEKLQNVEDTWELSVIENFAAHMSGSQLKTEKLENILSREEMTQVESGLGRLRQLGNAARQHDVDVLVDAELTSLNPGIRLFTLALMIAFNKDNSHIWYTYQSYLKRVMRDIEADQEVLAHFGNVGFGAKLVRGAYMDQERAVARSFGRPDPINDTYSDTSNMYLRAASHLLKLAASAKKPFKITIATHNEDAISHAINTMQELGIGSKPRCEHQVSFAQLMGMCDHTSHVLGKNGLVIYKSMPYGTVSEVIPYLYRRAMENFSVLERTTTERKLIANEIKRRLHLSS